MERKRRRRWRTARWFIIQLDDLCLDHLDDTLFFDLIIAKVQPYSVNDHLFFRKRENSIAVE